MIYIALFLFVYIIGIIFFPVLVRHYQPLDNFVRDSANDRSYKDYKDTITIMSVFWFFVFIGFGAIEGWKRLADFTVRRSGRTDSNYHTSTGEHNTLVGYTAGTQTTTGTGMYKPHKSMKKEDPPTGSGLPDVGTHTPMPPVKPPNEHLDNACLGYHSCLKETSGSDNVMVGGQRHPIMEIRDIEAQLNELRQWVSEIDDRTQPLVKEEPSELFTNEWPSRSGQGWSLGDYRQAINSLRNFVEEEITVRLEDLEKKESEPKMCKIYNIKEDEV